MDVGEARRALAAFLEADATPQEIRDAWQAMDGSLSSGGALPEAWERYTSGPAAEYVGCSQRVWATAVNSGSAPAPDGQDTAGRAVWSRTSLNRVKGPTGPRWLQRPKRPREHPPLTGEAATTPAWAAWAKSVGLEVGPYDERRTIITRARLAGLLPTA